MLIETIKLIVMLIGGYTIGGWIYSGYKFYKFYKLKKEVKKVKIDWNEFYSKVKK